MHRKLLLSKCMQNAHEPKVNPEWSRSERPWGVAKVLTADDSNSGDAGVVYQGCLSIIGGGGEGTRYIVLWVRM